MPRRDTRKTGIPVKGPAATDTRSNTDPAPGVTGGLHIPVNLEGPHIPGRHELRQRVVNMSSGCIGVSGLRGSGKTALIQDFCAHQYGTPHVPTPRTSADEPFPPRAVRRSGRRRFACPGGGLSAGGWPHWAPRTWELVGGILALVAGLAAIGWRTRWAVIEARQVITLAADAQARLRRLQFLRTETRTRGGKLSGPMGAGVSMGTSSEFAELAITLPELIDDYRDFVERVVGGLEQAERAARAERGSEDGQPPGPETSVRLVIGLDEIDQIDDAAKACRFLDELSAVFGTPQCVYLIAVSPDTLSADQRTVLTAGGLFDEMVWLDPLTATEAADLLAG